MMRVTQGVRMTGLSLMLGFLVSGVLAQSSALRPATAGAKPTTVVRLRVEPPTLPLQGPRARGRYLVSAQFSDGTTRDVTAQATRLLPPNTVARLESDGTLAPLKDGTANLTVAYGGKTATAPVVVKDATKSVPISFSNEVVPILTRFGCNQGACHGSQYGKGGFKLSLAGFDTDLDYLSLVKQAKGRRLSLAAPTQSLFLLKAVMAVPHGGGRRLETNSPAYKVLVQWLKEGVPGPQASDPVVTKLEVYPAERVLQKGGPSQPLIVRAIYSDNSIRDVTPESRLGTLNDAVASCTPEGVVSPVGKGQTAIMVRYGGHATVAMMMVPFKEGVQVFRYSGVQEVPKPTSQGKGERAVSNAQLPTSNDTLAKIQNPKSKIQNLDVLVEKKQQQLGLTPSPLCDDRTFLRRVSLDLIGTLPTAEEVKAFLADRAPNKREKLVDALLDRPEYADYWALKWGDLLRSNRTNLGPKGMWSFTNWIRGQVQQNRPVDQMTHDLILAQGSTFTSGPSNYYRVASNPNDLAETTSQLFLGVRMQCAKCHHHPFEKWSQKDYYQFAAFFARVGIKGSQEFGMFGNEQIVRINDGGEVYHPKTGQKMLPTPLGATLATLSDGKTPDPDAEGDRRRALADWLVGTNNRLFAKNIANRYWGYLFGKGIVNPIDDQRVTNPPTNPALLEALADILVQSKYDLKQLLRAICLTKTYQRSSEATPDNQADELFFTHYLPKRLPAEALLDAINTACGVKEKFGELPLGTRAIQLPDPVVNSDFLDTFGRPPRLIACECERMPEPNLSQTLRLMNGNQINSKLAQGDGRIAKLVAAKKSNDTILNDLYLTTLGRPPSRRERNQILGLLAFSPDRRPVFEDVLLTLLNSKEFLFNH